MLRFVSINQGSTQKDEKKKKENEEKLKLENKRGEPTMMVKKSVSAMRTTEKEKK